MHLDKILVRIGEFGRYQYRQYALLMLPIVLVTCQTMSVVFTVFTPDFWCAGSENTTLLGGEINNTDCVGDACEYDEKCFILEKIPSGNERAYNHTIFTLTKCERWRYGESEYGQSAVTEFNLVCDRQYLRALPSTSFMIGVLISSLVLGYLADRFGRKKMFILGLFLQGTAGLVSAWLPEVFSFVVFRFILALGNNISYMTAFVLGMELVGPSKRVITGIAICIVYAIGYFLLTGLALVLQNWRHLQTVISSFSFLFLCYYWIIPESVHWLVSHGRAKDAEIILREAAKINKKTFPSELSHCNENDVQEDHGHSVPIIEYLRHKKLAIRSLIIFFNWFAISLCYYGLTLNSGNVKGNVYVNFLISGTVEIPACLLVILTLNRFGRKKILCCNMLLCGIALLCTMFVEIYAAEDLHWLIIFLSNVGKFGASAAFSIIYLYTAELYPTIARNAGLGASAVCAKFGSIAGPYIADLNNLISSKYATALPLVIFGLLSFFGGLLVLLLPETAGKDLPQTIEDSLRLESVEKSNETKMNLTSNFNGNTIAMTLEEAEKLV